MRALLLISILLGPVAGIRAEEAGIDWEKARSFWSFQSPVRPALPEVKHATWLRQGVDAFVLHRLEENGLAPLPEADRAALARRLYFDLTGLPPTAAEVAAFEKSEDPNAYYRLVNSLLASPRFGERLASMWMTVARFAEDQAHQVGSNTKYFYPQAHLYRQWVIDAFNRDLPYDQFVRLQLAADSYDDAKEDLVALGFLGLGPQYYNRKRLDVLVEEWEDRVDTVTRGFLGLTVACARCHDHFYDPISTEDYHALAGVFASTTMHNHKDGDRLFHVVKDGKVQDLPVFVRGNVEDKGAVVPRGFLKVLSKNEPMRFKEGSGRRELAEAIVSPDNPLTARVLVNRLWGEFFGRALVVTPSNFGANGQAPSHPQLLDYLAVRLQDSGWSIKALVREMVLSSTYRQSATRASDNRWLAGMNRRRLSAEMLRDAMLAVSGELNLDSQTSLQLADLKNRNRTVFARISRLELDAFLRQFDYPDANVHASGRDLTITPTQKLFLLNSPFMTARAAELGKQAGAKGVDGVDHLYRQVLSRAPTDAERGLVARYFAQGSGSSDRDWAGLAQVLLCSNAFLYRD